MPAVWWLHSHTILKLFFFLSNFQTNVHKIEVHIDLLEIIPRFYGIDFLWTHRHHSLLIEKCLQWLVDLITVNNTNSARTSKRSKYVYIGLPNPEI